MGGAGGLSGSAMPPEERCALEAGLVPSWAWLPCSSHAGAAGFLILCYGVIIVRGATLISDGSEMLLGVLSPSLVGGLLLSVLGALPDVCIVLASGIGPDAAENIKVGIGTLVGSNVLLMSLTWGASLWLGRCDLSGPGGTARDKRLSRPWDLARTGVTTDADTPTYARIMLASGLLWLIPQVPSWLHHGAADFQAPPALAGGVVCLLGLLAYCVYMVVTPELQRKNVERLQERCARHALTKTLDSLFDLRSAASPDGALDDAAVRKIFDDVDRDGDGSITTEEMQTVLVTPNTVLASPPDAHAETLMKLFDSNSDGRVDFGEFQQGLQSCLKEDGKRRANLALAQGPPQLDDPEAPLLGGAPGDGGPGDEESEEEAEHDLTRGDLWRRALGQMGAGVLIVAFFSDPLVGSLSKFSAAIAVPPFYVAFALAPFASNASEFIASLAFARKRRRKNISLTFAQVYGATTVNNTLNLGLFLFLIWAQRLPWVYSAEVVTLSLVTLAVGLVGGRATTLPAWLAFPALLLYPLTIVLVWLLGRGAAS